MGRGQGVIDNGALKSRSQVSRDNETLKSRTQVSRGKILPVAQLQRVCSLELEAHTHQ